MLVGSMSDVDDGNETRVLDGLKWIFFALGLGSMLMFLLEPDIHAHPELVLLGGTGLLGALSLRALAAVLRPTPDTETR